MSERPFPRTPCTRYSIAVPDDMFTVFFQKNDVRYIVVALPEHEAWLTSILTTWHFTD